MLVLLEVVILRVEYAMGPFVATRELFLGVSSEAPFVPVFALIPFIKVVI